ncbi:MAG TPA: leucine-rich repeat domain-containing protein [Candidatus Elarobacter sp.]
MQDALLIEEGSYGPRVVLTREPAPDDLIKLRDRAVLEVVMNDGVGWRGSSVAFVAELPWLRALELRSIVVKIEDDSAVSDLHELVKLALETYCTNAIDFSGMPLLERLSYIWRKRTSGLPALRRLRELSLTQYGVADLAELSAMKQLTRFEVLGGAVREIRDIASLTELRRVRLASLRRLTSLDGLEALHQLEFLMIQSCKGIQSVEPLAGCVNLRELYLDSVGDIESLLPLRGLKRLEAVSLIESTTVADGRIAFLREMGVKLNFGPRKHYDAAPGLRS